MMGRMFERATKFNVYYVRGKAIVLPCVSEYRARRGWVGPRLRVRAPLLFGYAGLEQTQGWADGWNSARQGMPKGLSAAA